ncbi:MAG: DUF1015 family protein [Halobacteriota archaeon]|nr:DUF1015 family protein [Halobacteriota archaeon]
MVKIKPFRATVLNPELQDKENLICPVYDTIDSAGFGRYSKYRNNVIHFTTRRDDMYEKDFLDYAKKSLDRLFSEGVLKEMDEPAIYIYGIRYNLTDEMLEQLPKGDRREMYFIFGLVVLVKVDELGKDSIVGHEKIFEVNTRERYDLMKRCDMNFSPILAEYSMPGHEINNIFEDYLGFKRPDLKLSEDKMPVLDVMLDGSRHLLWKVSEYEIIKRVQELIHYKEIMILDGHHRYTASDSLRKNDGVGYTMMMLVEGGDRALLLLPWHRCVKDCDTKGMWKRIKEDFVVESYDRTEVKKIHSRLSRREAGYVVKIGMYDGEKTYILKLPTEKVEEIKEERGEKIGLDLIILHEWLINPFLIGEEAHDVVFSPLPSEVTDKVDKEGYKIAFIVNPLSIADVEDKAHRERRNFPQKSTRFLPKVAEGIIMRRLSTDG